MTSSKPYGRLRRILSKALIALIGLLGLVLILALLLIAFLPTIVSTDRANQFILMQLDTALPHPVQIQKINWSWKSGFTAKGIKIPGHPDFSPKPMAEIPRAHLEIEISDLFKRRLNFSFFVESPVIHLVRDQAGRLNLAEAFGGPQRPEKEKPPEPEASKTPFKLPLDISTDIHLADISITYQDQAAGRHYRVKNGDIHLKAPDVVGKPVSASIAADISVNGQDLPHAAINGTVQNLFDSSRQMRLNRVAARIDADLPGAAVHVQGDMADTGIKASVSLDLKALAGAAAPLLPKLLDNSDINGHMELKAEAARTAPDIIGFDAALSGKAVSLAGKMLSGNSLGPGDMRVAAAGEMDLDKFDLKLDQSEIKLLANTRLTCRGSLRDLKSPAPAVDFTIAPVHVDLKEMAAFGKDYLPPGLIPGQTADSHTDLSIEKIRIKGRLPAGQTSINIQALELNTSGVGYQTGIEAAEGIKIEDAGVAFQSVNAVLDDLMPSSAELRAAVNIGHLTYEAGETRMSMRGFSLDSLRVKAGQISMEEDSPLGVSGEFELSNTAKMSSFELEDLLALSETSQSLDVSMAVHPDGKAAGTIDHVHIKIPGVHIENSAYGLPETSAGLDLSLAEFQLNDMETWDVDMKGLNLGVDAGGMITLNLTAAAEQSGKNHFHADLVSDIRLDRIVKALHLEERLNMEASGDANVRVQIAGRRPDPRQLEDLKAFKINENLGFLDLCKITLNLADGGLRYQKDKDDRVTIDGISGDPLFAYTLSGKNADGKLSSQIHINRVMDVMGMQPADPVSGRFMLDLRHKGLDRMNVTQHLQIQPGNIDQSIEIALDGITPDIWAKSPYEIFQQISGRAAANVTLQESRALKNFKLPALSAIDVNGAIESSVTVQKRPADTVEADVQLNMREFSAEMGDLFAFSGINGNIGLSRKVTIKPAASMTDGDRSSTRLSQQMMQGSRDSLMTDATAAGAFSGSMNPLTGHADRKQGISLQSGKISAAGVPIRIGPSRINIGLSRGLPAIDSLKLDILGGTLIGDLLINPQSGGYFLETRMNFTGLDAASIFPEAAADMKSGASEISGAIYANIPVARKMENLLENAEVVIEFRKIGSRALERLLYALDPYESNEAIVSQRRLLRMGSPKQVQLSIKDGFLSLEGSVLVKSVPISIPPLQRLNIARLPGIQAYANTLSVMAPIIQLLDLASAETLAAEEVFDR
ncbi:MAG: AsmA family protein [Desulfobacterales bacterium]|nr:AsmA family protein [Desulfobacterales bacterium]